MLDLLRSIKKNNKRLNTIPYFIVKPFTQNICLYWIYSEELIRNNRCVSGTQDPSPLNFF